VIKAVATNSIEEVGGPSEPKTPHNADVEVSSESDEEVEEDEEDLVRFEDIMSVASCIVGALEHINFTQNIDWHALIARSSHKYKQFEFSVESSKTEYNLEPQTSMSIVSSEFEEYY